MRLGQSVRMQIAAIVSHELLNTRSCDLRDQVADLLIVSPRVQRFQNVPMIALFLKFHFARRSFEHDPNNLRHDQVSQFSIAEILRFFVDRLLDRLVREKGFFGIPKPDIHLAFQGRILPEENLRWRIRAN